MATSSNSRVQKIPDYLPASGSPKPRLRMRDGSKREIEVLNSLSYNGEARHTVITSPKDLHQPAFRADLIAQVQKVHNVMMQAFCEDYAIDPADVEFTLDEQNRCVIQAKGFAAWDGATANLAKKTCIAETQCTTVADVMCAARDALLFPEQLSGLIIQPESDASSQVQNLQNSRGSSPTFRVTSQSYTPLNKQDSSDTDDE